MTTALSFRKVIITGPESSGKTTLARELAAQLSGVWVAEYARHYLEQLGRPYGEDDLLAIAKGQLLWESFLASTTPPYLICDTSMLVIKVWSEYRYGRCHPWVEEQFQKSRDTLYLLCAPDIPWEADPLRENPDDRNALLTLYREELETLGAPFRIIAGAGRHERLADALRFITSAPR